MQLPYCDAANRNNLLAVPHILSISCSFPNEKEGLPEVWETILYAHYLPFFSTGQQVWHPWLSTH